MAEPRSPSVRTASVGLLLVIAGIALWVLYRYQSGREHASFAKGGAPAAYVHITHDKTYWISVAGGADTLQRLGVDIAALQCTAATPGSVPGALAITPQSPDTKAIDQIASFVAPLTGNVHVECNRVGAVYIDDADGAYDYAGLWLLLATIALVVGVPLALAPVVLKRRDEADRPDAEPEFDPAPAG